MVVSVAWSQWRQSRAIATQDALNRALSSNVRYFMKRDGKRLEALVAFVERTLLPQGFVVTTNDRVYNDEGVQIAEFDIHAKGKIGTTEFKWLIECRDRPASGPAPVSWIEQLVGRRTRFKFNKITAVSTTGFAIGAAEFGQTEGIELREVKSLTPDEFADWLVLRYITNQIRHTTLLSMNFLIDEGTADELRNALSQMLPTITGTSQVLRSSASGELVSPAFAFSGVATAHPDLFEGLEPNGEVKRVRLLNQYPNDDYFIIDTPLGPLIIRQIEFTGELRINETKLPIIYTGQYRDANTGEPIADVVSFAPQSIMGMPFSVEMHKLAETGETHVTLRRLPSEASQADPLGDLV